MPFPLKRESLLLLSSLALLAALVVWVRTLTVKETYLYVRKERELRQVEYDLQNARLRLIRLTSPAKLQVRAQDLGLGVPKANQIVQWKKFVVQKATP